MTKKVWLAKLKNTYYLALDGEFAQVLVWINDSNAPTGDGMSWVPGAIQSAVSALPCWVLPPVPGYRLLNHPLRGVEAEI